MQKRFPELEPDPEISITGVENDIKVWIGVQKRVVTMMLTGMTDYSDIT